MSSPNSEEPPKIEPENSDDEDSESSESSKEEEEESGSKSDSDSDDEPSPYSLDDGAEEDNSPEANMRRFEKLLFSKRRRREDEEDEDEVLQHEDPFDFPPDPENWREEDLRELWADAPVGMTKPGWDPHNVDPEEVDVLREEIKAGRDPPIAPFYVPYRKHYPVIPTNNHDIRTPKAVIEELDRIEEFLKWVSFIFEDGSTYEGTVWDDLAHGKGVFVAEQGLVRYEGEWLQNQMEGHGVVEVEIPMPEPIPGSKLEAKMRAEGRIISRDYMSPEDREWLEMDIEDSLKLADGEWEIPFYENEEWIRQFGELPEKGRYRYAGQWKHGRMHGCGVYEVNERTTFGRFYFGELLQDDTYGCEAEISGMHAGIAEVAAAKARMFINKPDGMVREDRGPYSDPQHPYLYEEEDVWMAPGFINQFYEVPDYWKMYVHEVDIEREMWLNSFYRAPLRLPGPAEMEYWWSTYEEPEFVLINNEPVPDPEDPSKLVYEEPPLILHTPTGRIINYVDDEEHGIRLFWQPLEGEEQDPDKLEFLPLGFDEFYADAVDEKEKSKEQKLKELDMKLKELDMKRAEAKELADKQIEARKKELELMEAEWALEDALEELDEAYKIMQEEEERKAEEGIEEEDVSVSESTEKIDSTPAEVQEEDEEEEDDEDDDDDGVNASSFGSAVGEKSTNDDQKGSNGKSKFASTSLFFAGSNLFSLVPQKLQNQFLSWKGRYFEKRVESLPTSPHPVNQLVFETKSPATVSFPLTVKGLKLRCERKQTRLVQEMPMSRKWSKMKPRTVSRQGWEELGILSLHTPITT